VDAVAVIDFETTGLSPAHGSRATEIGVAIWERGKIVDRYQSLMNAGVAIPPDIQALTGISNTMLRSAPPVDRIMREVSRFVGDLPLAAHNASFDQKFWHAERARIGLVQESRFICTMLLARRLIPSAVNHRLGTLAHLANLPSTGQAHRALADAETAAGLLGYLQSLITQRHGLSPDFALLHKLQRISTKRFADVLHKEFLDRSRR
jgi:DNA polymerase-3 subunit epsilon